MDRPWRNIYLLSVLGAISLMKPNREKIEAEELVKERLPLTKWELTPKEKEDFKRVMRLHPNFRSLPVEIKSGTRWLLDSLNGRWSAGHEHFDRMTLHRCLDSSPIFFELFLIDGLSSREYNVCRHGRSGLAMSRLYPPVLPSRR
jgi:hypothetical protein